MQMPDILEGYHVDYTLPDAGRMFISSYQRHSAQMLKDVWPTLSKGTQENAMKLTLLLTLRGRTGIITVEGVGAVYALGSVSIVIVPEENADDY